MEWGGVGDQDTAFLEILGLEVQGHIAEIEMMNLPTPTRPQIDAAPPPLPARRVFTWRINARVTLRE